MKSSARRYPSMLLCLMPALLTLMTFGPRMANATRNGASAAANKLARNKTTQSPHRAAISPRTTALAPTQSGGGFTLVKAGVTSGGEHCANGTFSLNGAAGQFSADLLAGGTFSIGGGLLGSGGGGTQCPVITITPTSLPTATLNELYEQTLTASGGVAPYSFDISSVTSPPAGLRFNPNGTLVGSPVELGLFPFTARATDANGCTATQSYTLLVQPAAIVVNTVADTVAADGFCSLREALQAANTNMAVNECATGNAGLDIIAFDLGTGTPRIDVTGTPLPFITESIVLDGAAGPGGATRVELNGMSAGANADGLDLRATDSSLRSLVINRFSRDGIVINSYQNKVENCLIGTDTLAAIDQGNQRYGIHLLGPSNMIGGTAPGTRNVISGNDGGGVFVASSSNTVCGNYIGTNLTGLTALGNGASPGDFSFGIRLSGGGGPGINNVIGGTSNAAHNVIAGNFDVGILTFGTSHNLIQGNFIGLKSDGSGLLGNGGEGINLSSTQEQIGGDQPNTGNVIAGNGRVGIRVQDFNGNIASAGGSHVIEGNSIYGNNGTGILIDGGGFNRSNRLSKNAITNNAFLGIDLTIGNLGAGARYGDSVTFNSLSGLNSTYPNTRLPFPVLDAALTPGSATGSYAAPAFINAIPAYPVRLEFFASATCDCSGYGEGETYLGDLTLQADGTFTFNYTPVAGKPVITATAIDANGNTSEFSQCVGGPPQTPPVITTHPASQTVAAGASVTFSVAAAGTNLSYQWRKNGSDLSGATASNYTIASLTAADAGDYDVVVSDTCGRTATSTSATLTIGVCPLLTVGPVALPNGVVGQAYPTTSFTAAGGSNTTVFNLTGTLPSGLIFSNGQLSGTPAQAGSFTFTVTATEGTCINQRAYTLIVGALNLQAIGNEGFVALNWTHSGFGTLNGFKLYRATAIIGPFTLHNGALAANATSFNANSVTPNTAYFYKLTVVDANNVESAFSNVAAATPVDVVPPVIVHTPLTATVPPNLAIPLSATVTDNTGVQSVKLFFRATGAGNYTERLMTASGNLYSTAINANEVVAPGVDYYLEARDAASVVRAGQPDAPHHFAVVDQPFVDSLTPIVGASTGGTTVTLTGRNFKTGAVVQFDQAIAAVTSNSPTQIVCTTPPHFPALVDVRVSNPGGASDVRTNAFTYQAASTLSLPVLSGARNVRLQIPINATVSGLTSADVRITFNNAVLNAVSAQLGTLVPNWSLQANLGAPGEIRLAMASSSGPVTGAGTLAVLEFEVPGAASSSSPLTFANIMLNGGALSATTTNGTFNVLPEYVIAGTVRHWQTTAGVPNVQLALTGAGSYSATSNGSGVFSLNEVLPGNYTLTPSKSDGAVGISALDASLMLQHSAGLITLTGNALLAADIDRSGTVNSQDAFYGLQYAVGLLGLPFPGADRVWDFSPATRSYANLNTNQTNQDFAAVLLGDVNGSFTGGNQPSTLATLALPTVTVPNGAEFLLPLTLSLPSGSLYGAELRISYDPALLQVLAVEASSPTNNWLRAANLNMPGLLRVALAGTQGFTGSGELLRLRLRAHGAAGTASAVTITHASLNEGGFGTTLTAGRVTLRKRAVKADFDVDGQTDLAVWRGVTGDWLIQRSGNQTLQTVAWGTSNDPYNDVVASGDYDGDGKADVAIWRPSDGGWYIRHSSNGATVTQLWGTRGDVPVAEDYDGDGKADLAVWRPSDGTWYVLRSSDGSYLIEAWGMAGDMPVVGDYDGDGKADLAVWRPGDGYWYLKLSTGGTQVTAWGVGYAPYFDTPVPADYDGDGKTDLAIWRGADSLWYIRQSSDGQPLIRRWGANYAPYHDVPTPGDYDGDGKADIAVWRPADGTWYVWRSSNGTFLIQQHGQPGDTPIPASRHSR